MLGRAAPRTNSTVSNVSNRDTNGSLGTTSAAQNTALVRLTTDSTHRVVRVPPSMTFRDVCLYGRTQTCVRRIIRQTMAAANMRETGFCMKVTTTEPKPCSQSRSTKSTARLKPLTNRLAPTLSSFWWTTSAGVTSASMDRSFTKRRTSIGLLGRELSCRISTLAGRFALPRGLRL